MIKKGLAVAVILLFIGVAFIPNVSAYDKEINDDIIEPLDIGRTIIRGFGLFPHFSGNNLTFFYLNFKSDLFGWITLRIANQGFMLIGPFNIIIYVFGASFKGGIEW